MCIIENTGKSKVIYHHFSRVLFPFFTFLLPFLFSRILATDVMGFCNADWKLIACTNIPLERD